MQAQPSKQKPGRGWLLLAALLFAGCGQLGTPQPQAASGDGYLLTVQTGPADTREAVAQRFGGEVIAWLGENAILKLTEAQAASLRSGRVSLQNTTLEPNARAFAPATAAGFSAWAGGFSAWAGGFSAWAGGWSAWAGGTGAVPSLPGENRPLYRQIRLPQAFAASRDYGRYVTVAVIDTGVDLNHPMIKPRLAPSYTWFDFAQNDAVPQEAAGSYYGHGTGVAGVILQVAPMASILPIRALGSDGSASVSTVITAIQHAITWGANIINLSLGTTSDVAALRTIIDSATTNGIYVVASAGNGASTALTFPAAYAKSGANANRVMSVGSVNSGNGRSSFSNSGANLEFLAPGEGLYSAYPDGRLAVYSGTSFAAPVVTGTLALAFGETGLAGWSDGELRLSQSARGVGGTGNGFGVVNVSGTVAPQIDWRRMVTLVVADGNSLTGGETALKGRLEAMGFTVWVDSDEWAGTMGELVVLSPGVNASVVTTRYRDTAMPVVVMQSALYDDMGMTSAAGGRDLGTQLKITSPSHPMAYGLSGNPTVYTGSDWVGWGTPASGAVKVAESTANSSRAPIFAYDAGAAMVGLNAPHRRVGLFLGDTTAPTRLNSSGWDLFEAAVTWAMTGN